MDADDLRHVAEISKINFLLENLYGLVLREIGASHEDIPRLTDEICRQAMLPGSTYGPAGTPEETSAQTELVAHRLAVFFSGVRDRLRSDGAY